MIEFYADVFVRIMSKLQEWESWCEKHRSNYVLAPHELLAMRTQIDGLIEDCVNHRLHGSVQKCERIILAFQTPPMQIKAEELRQFVKDLRERVEDDLAQDIFLHLSKEESDLYDTPLKNWEDVINRFPKMQHDIEEASRCFAVMRYAASLFHILLVAEYGIIQLAVLLGVAGDKPGWGSLARLENIMKRDYAQRSPLEKQYSDLLSNTLVLAHAIKDSWRHKISHIENKLQWIDTDFSPELTDEITKAVRGFMRRLARDLPSPVTDPSP